MTTGAKRPPLAEEEIFNISQFEGWSTMVDRPARVKPANLSAAQLEALTSRDRLVYNEERRIWHANLGPYLTPQMQSAVEQIDTIADANRQDGSRVRSSAVLDALPGLGKTTLAVHFGSEFHRTQIALYGETTHGGHKRVPVAYVRLTSSTTMRSLNQMLCRFYGLPNPDRGTATQLGARATAAAIATATRLIIIDDVHFLDMHRRDGREVANHFKWLANEFPSTFLFVGVGIVGRKLLSEGLGASEAHFAQTARRWTTLGLPSLRLDDDEGRSTWRRLLLALERDLVLARKDRGMLAEDLGDYLFVRSSGHFASLMALVARGCHRAMKTGEERLSADLLDHIKNDAAAEEARKRLAQSVSYGLITGKRLD